MKLLVVEDEPLIRLGLTTLLEDYEYEVVEAANAHEAIDILEADTDIAMVLTDVDMPGGMDGIGLAQYVRNRWPPVQLIVISGKVGLSLGELPVGSKFIGKPYQAPQLLALVQGLASIQGNLL